MGVMRDEARGVLVLISIAIISLSAHSEPPHPSSSSLIHSSGYTNHAGNVIAGWPVKLTATQVTLGHGGVIDPALPGIAGRAVSTKPPRGETYPLSIFPESEQRRIAADFGEPRLPLEVKRAIAGAEKAMARSRKRAEKGLCTKEESEAFCAKSQTALRNYLDKQVESGTITPAERKAICR